MRDLDIHALGLKPGFELQQDYHSLGKAFFTEERASSFRSPRLLLFNEPLALELGMLQAGSSWSSDAWASVLSGQQLLPGSNPISQAYAGHQFGQFNKLGDGRALLLGEVQLPQGKLADLQLKGSGPTAWSRRGDGKATLSAMLREYLISEAIHALGIPGSRSLSVVATGEAVRREQLLPGAVLGRVAESHLRVGTLEYAGHLLGVEELKKVVDYTIKRHYSELLNAENPALELLRKVIEKQVTLMVHWMRVGFIHGVMNTDNMSLAGISLDYGPCAFMNAYSPGTVFSSIDTQGRYAFGNQPYIMQWNLACLASALLPMLDSDKPQAIELAQAEVNALPKMYEAAWIDMMRIKLGLPGKEAADVAMVDDLLALMEREGRDYTNTFLMLTGVRVPEQPASDAFQQWKVLWKERRGSNENSLVETQTRMKKANPVYIPRNERVEEALADASERNEWSRFMMLQELLQSPYKQQEGYDSYMLPPADGEGDYCTFCGT